MKLLNLLKGLTGFKPEAETVIVEALGSLADVEVGDVNEVTNLKKALQSERDAKDTAQASLKKLEQTWEGIDPEKAKKALSGGTASEAEFDAALESRMQQFTKDTTKRVEALENRNTRLSKKALGRFFLEATNEMGGMHKGGVKDAVIRMENLFTLSDDDEPVMLDQNGKVIYGKDGVSPLSPVEWLESQKEENGHWFENGSSGGGAGGGGDEYEGKKTMKLSDFEGKTPQEKSDFINKEGGVVIDD